MILGIILAGGQGTRMGGTDKCLLELGGQTLLTRIIDRLGPQVDGLILNANGDPERFSDYDLPVVPDPVEDFPGPLGGVLAGLDAAAERGAKQIVTVAGDTPFFPLDLAQRLQEAADEARTPIALAVTPDPERGVSRHPTFGLWPVDLRDDLRAALKKGIRKVVAWTDPHGAAAARFDDQPDAFFNINTPTDLSEAKDRLKDRA